MKIKIVLQEINSIDEIANKWTNEDFFNLLELFEYEDTSQVKLEELKDLVYLVISDADPQEAAAILLNYKLGDELNQGQIEQVSHDMLKENVAEHHSDISLHSRLFDINVLLYKAYNGKFPHAQASVITVKIQPVKDQEFAVDKPIALRLLSHLIDDHAIYKRIFKEQIQGLKDFDEAHDIIWYLKPLKENLYEIITSDYWINEGNFTASEEVVDIDIEA